MRPVTKMVIGVLAVAAALVALWWLTHTGGVQPLSQGQVGGRTPPAAAVPPFKITRQAMAGLAAARVAATPVQPRVQAASGAPPASTTPDDERARRLRQAQAAVNAADVYRLIFLRLDTTGCKAALNRFRDLTGSKSYADLSREGKEELRALLETPDLREVLALLQEAARKARCDFELDYAQGFALQLPHLAQLRGLVSLASGAAYVANDGGDGRSAGALIELALKTAANAGHDEILVSQLVQIACDRKALECLGAMSQNLQFSEEQAYALLVEIARRDYGAGLAAAARKEALLAATMLERLTTGETPAAVFEGALSASPEGEKALQQYLADPAYVARNKAKYQELSDRLVQLFALPYDATVQARADQLLKEVEGLPADTFALVRVLFAALPPLIRKAGVATDGVDVSFVEVATAIYRAKHGRDPASAADLKEVLDKAEAYSIQHAGQP